MSTTKLDRLRDLYDERCGILEGYRIARNSLDARRDALLARIDDRIRAAEAEP